MLEVPGDLWSYKADYRCIPTNGVVTSDGRLVMGAGVAKAALELSPWIDRMLGNYVKEKGNIPCILDGSRLISFPTKSHWKGDSSLGLISDSAHWIANWAKNNESPIIVLPRVGCGLGGLRWDTVQPLLSQIFVEDNFVVVN